MGLDIVEIMVEIENNFCTEIQEEAAKKIDTVGDLIDYVGKEVRKEELPEWKAKQIYVESLTKAKRKIASAVGISETEITDDDLLGKHIPKKRRRAIWKSHPVFAELGTLTHSKRLLALAVFVSGLGGMLCFVRGTIIFGSIGGFAGIVAFFSLFIAIYYFLPARTIASSATVSDFARLLARKEGIHLNPQGELWTREQITLCVCEIITNVGGFESGDVNPEHHLVKDLSLG